MNTNTPLLLKYELDFHGLSELQYWKDNYPHYFEISEICGSGKFELLRQLREWFTSIYFGSGKDSSVPSESFKLMHDVFWLKFDIISSGQTIGEAWMPISHIDEIKGKMMYFRHFDLNSKQSAEKIYQCLQDYEREKTKYCKIDMVYHELEWSDKSSTIVKIDDSGVLTCPVRIRHTFSNGKTLTSLMTWDDWIRFDADGNYMKIKKTDYV